MSIRFKDPREHSICTRCSSGVVMEGDSESSRRVYCHSINEIVPQPITKCSSFMPRMEMSRYDMENIATIIDLNKGEIGFIKPGHKHHPATGRVRDPWDL